MRVIQILQWPIYLVRYFTDPMVDFTSCILGRVFASMLPKVASGDPDITSIDPKHTKVSLLSNSNSKTIR